MSDEYAVAIVVGRDSPVSSHLGDRAIVYADGRMEGFIGGSCSRDIVRRQALDAIQSGEPRLVRITPDEGAPGDGRDVVTVPMHCVSEGTVEVFIEPHVSQRKLIVTGLTPVAQALAELAPTLGYTIVRFVDRDELCDVDGTTIDALGDYLDGLEEHERERCAIVIASQGHYDDTAIAAIARHDFGYVGLLASSTRGGELLAGLHSEGLEPERLAALRYPAGIAIGARKPKEVAISIFAEIIASNAARASQQRELFSTVP